MSWHNKPLSGFAICASVAALATCQRTIISGLVQLRVPGFLPLGSQMTPLIEIGPGPSGMKRSLDRGQVLWILREQRLECPNKGHAKVRKVPRVNKQSCGNHLKEHLFDRGDPRFQPPPQLRCDEYHN